jgi:hypothetical protein
MAQLELPIAGLHVDWMLLRRRIGAVSKLDALIPCLVEYPGVSSPQSLSVGLLQGPLLRQFCPFPHSTIAVVRLGSAIVSASSSDNVTYV